MKDFIFTVFGKEAEGVKNRLTSELLHEKGNLGEDIFLGPLTLHNVNNLQTISIDTSDELDDAGVPAFTTFRLSYIERPDLPEDHRTLYSITRRLGIKTVTVNSPSANYIDFNDKVVEVKMDSIIFNVPFDCTPMEYNHILMSVISGAIGRNNFMFFGGLSCLGDSEVGVSHRLICAFGNGHIPTSRKTHNG